MKEREPEYFDRDCCRPFLLEGGEKGVVLLHGFTGSISHMRPLGNALNDRGYTVKGINLPGHATTEADMAKQSWQTWLHAAKEATLEMLERCSAVTICGLSMGGVLALLVAEQMRVAACVPIAAPMGVKNKLMGLAGILAPIYPRVSWGAPNQRQIELDPDYDFGYSGFPTAKAADLNKLIHLARANLFNINCPTLAVQSADDETIWTGSADCILDAISSEKKEKLWLQGVPHVCTISKELPRIVDAMAVWMQAL